MNRGSLPEACDLLEEDNTPMEMMWIGTELRDQHVLIVVRMNSSHRYLKCSDIVLDVDQWRRFGRVVRNIKRLKFLYIDSFMIKELEDAVDGELLGAADRCIDAFFAEVKHNRSIVNAEVHLRTGLADELSGFILNSKALKGFRLISEEPVLLEESAAISSAIGSVQLEYVSIDCCFENDGSFEQMLEECKRVDKLSVSCLHGWQFTAVADFLRDPSNEINKLNLRLHEEFSYLDTWFGKETASDLSASLMENKTLKSLRLLGKNQSQMDWFDSKKLLCDVSSIRSISNSNHALEEIEVCDSSLDGTNTQTEIVNQCLVLNRNEDKARVLRDKILRFYFVGEFDVSPFINVSLSVMPEVMTQIEGDGKQSAMYRLLQRLPDLCNVSNRVSPKYRENKRRKMDSVPSGCNDY